MSAYYVLDLDNTVLLSTPISRHEISTDKNPDVRYIADLKCQFFRVQLRRHFTTFINGLLERGKLIVWSAGSDVYVKTICDIFFDASKLALILTHSNLVNKRKKLCAIKEYIPDFEVSKAILIDDKLENGHYYPERILGVIPFFGEQDDELLKVLDKIDAFDKQQPAIAGKIDNRSKQISHTPKLGATFA